MNNQRLRNLTTGRLHTCIKDIKEDLAGLLGLPDLQTINILSARDTVILWLVNQVSDMRFWELEYDLKHTGHLPLPTPTPVERVIMLHRYDARHAWEGLTQSNRILILMA